MVFLTRPDVCCSEGGVEKLAGILTAASMNKNRADTQSRLNVNLIVVVLCDYL